MWKLPLDQSPALAILRAVWQSLVMPRSQMLWKMRWRLVNSCLNGDCSKIVRALFVVLYGKAELKPAGVEKSSTIKNLDFAARTHFVA